MNVDPSGLDTAVVIGGPSANNPLGHAAIGFTGKGVFSYGTNTPLGSSFTDYIARQAQYRGSTVFTIKTNGEQEDRMLRTILAFSNLPLPDFNKSPTAAYRDNCATRTQAALHAGGIGDWIADIIGTSPLPYDTAAVAALYANDITYIPKQTSVSESFSQFDPRP